MIKGQCLDPMDFLSLDASVALMFINWETCKGFGIGTENVPPRMLLQK